MQNHRPLGYYIKEGKILIDKKQEKTVLFIFSEYGNGKSMRQIANGLKAMGAQNGNGKVVWRHPAVGRLLENEKYLGNEFFPKIIEGELFEKVQEKRTNLQKALGRGEYRPGQEERKLFAGRLVCGACGEPYRHYHDSHRGKAEHGKWKCKRYISKGSVLCGGGFIDDSEIKKVCMNAINKIIQHPEMMNRISNLPETFSKEYLKLNRMIGNSKDGEIKSKDEFKELLRQRAETRYEGLIVQDMDKQTNFMEEMLEGITEQHEFNGDLFQMLVRRIIINKDNTVTVEFINRSCISVKY